MSKLHVTYAINEKGKVSWNFWHEDGYGLMGPTTVEGAKAYSERLMEVARKAESIELRIASLFTNGD